MDALGDESVDMGVDPAEIVFSFLLFRLGPAALQAGIPDAGLTHEFLVFLEVGEIPVEGFAAHRPEGGCVEVGFDGNQLSGNGKRSRMGLNILPSN